MAITGFEATILDRLKLVHADLVSQGLKGVYRLPPSAPLDDSLLPALYAWPGPLLQPVPALASGSVVVRRVYIVRLLIAPALAPGRDTGTDGRDGAAAFADAVAWLGLISNHYMTHPRLQSSTVGATAPLAWMAEDLLVQDTGVGPKPGPGGADYVSIDWNLTIAMRGLVMGLA